MYIAQRTFEELQLLHKFISLVIFDIFEIKERMNFYDFFFSAIWTSYSTIKQKVRFILVLMSGCEEKVNFDQFLFVFTHSVNGFCRMFKGKRKLKPELIQLAAAKVSRCDNLPIQAFKSCDIDGCGTITLEEIWIWIQFNTEFETFLDSFTCVSGTKIDNAVFKPFAYEMDFKYFDLGVLNTQNKLIHRSRSLNTPKKLKPKGVHEDLLAEIGDGVKPQDKFKIRRARKLFKDTKHQKSPVENADGSGAEANSFESDSLIREFESKRKSNLNALYECRSR